MKYAHKAAGLALSAAIIITPLAAFAQSNTDATSQIQSLVSQITSLEQQLKSLLQSTVASGTPPMRPASSTPAWNSDKGDSEGMASSTHDQGNSFGAPCPMIDRNLSVGSSGSDVSSLQDMLSGLGFLNATSTGFFGLLTANALSQFQSHFGISSSTGSFGPRTRDFLRVRCGGTGGQQGGEGATGSSTPSVPWHDQWENGSSTPPCGMPYMPSSDAASAGSMSTNIIMIRPCGGMGSSTSGTPITRPCGPDDRNDSPTSTLSQTGAVAALLFVSHTIIPGMNGAPCHGTTMAPQQGSQTSGSSRGPMMPAGDQ